MRNLILLLLFPIYLSAQNSLADKTKNMEFKNGFINIYLDKTQGKVYAIIDKLDQEFLYVNSLPAGLGSNDIGLDRGQIGDTRIVYFNKVGKKLLLVQPNYDYRALSNDPNEKRAVAQSFAQSTLFSFNIELEENGQLLIDLTPFLLRDAHGVADRIRKMKQGTYSLVENRSALYYPNIKSFPKNTELEASITFVGGADAGRFVQAVAPSTEAITLRMHHSFVELPDHHYTPRKYDVRSGYFGISFYDYASDISEPIQKMYISRHRLEKKDPAAAVSEPVKPIIYYLDNGTPEPIRTALLSGARWWNQAFEAAGYKNAFQVEILPDSADPMDIRYNMINWVHRSTRGWSYGASITDPRTGEIIKGQVTLGSLRVRQDYLIFTSLLSPYENGKPVNEKMRTAALHRLRQLAAHEVGHTLGLQHNYASSYNNRASVMDYPHPNIFVNANNEIDFSDIYTNEIGEWDKRAIIFGYQDFPKNINESNALNQLLEENSKNGLLFIADADARAASGFHPYAHLWDNQSDAVKGLEQVLKVRHVALQHFNESALPNGRPLTQLEETLVPLYNYHRYQLEAVTKLIGGINYQYSVKGDINQITPSILPNSIQTRALDAALNCLSPNILTLPENILSIIPPRPPMYYGIGELFDKRTGMSFDALAAAEALSEYELAFLFNVERANRLVQNKARANTIGFDDVVDAILQKIWYPSIEKGLEGSVRMQTQLQIIHWLQGVEQSADANYNVKAICHNALHELKIKIVQLQKNIATNKTHFQYALNMIEHPDKISLPKPVNIAPGAPIGCDVE